MADIIHLLPDSIANQIAAGEVVQRPASVVKELVENSIDAGSESIQVSVRDGGKALIQVVDNGSGMSETDARLCFERHATSKIREAADLHAIRTLGFRGEAMAAIGAVAEVELRTRLPAHDVGTLLRMVGSELVEQRPTAAPLGTSVTVRNLFFNVPARRKFLKSASLELKHIISEFQRVALVRPQVAMSLDHNGAAMYSLPPAPLKQRIVNLMGRGMSLQLLDLDTHTSVIRITGYVGRPQSAKKSAGEQFFFVNGRYMRSPYLHRAVVNAYERMLPPESIPPYFIYFEVPPESIDVNIHPTKTEIKFEDERMVWQILHAAVRQTLGRFAVAPSIDFDTEMVIDIPFFPASAPVSPPEVEVNPFFNPFDADGAGSPPGVRGQPRRAAPSAQGWQALFHQERGQGFEAPDERCAPGAPTGQPPGDGGGALAVPRASQRFFQLKGRYILSSVKSGLMVIDQRRAHQRVLYEGFLQALAQGRTPAQQELFPHTLDLAPADYALLLEASDSLRPLGVEILALGRHTVTLQALPGNVRIGDPEEFVGQLVDALREDAGSPADHAHQRMARAMALASAIPYSRPMEPIEMQDLVDKLFGCEHPNLSPDGKPTLIVLETHELDRRFK